ncbi:hypothetical protein Cgig2_020352 [Carnegiea gigantea]|uniref:Rhodanese domain-containing protein n=1 Tax=Carnegiea gigantea TaxID=171969 RepID=A0A9Q1QGV9_9CARY|nr:hypothetical protein Cgig2_020352 [Carnegiea gigantea]
MAGVVNLSASSACPARLRWHKLNYEHPLIGVSLKKTSVSVSVSVPPLRCCFSHPSRNSNYRSRRAGVTSNLEATETGVPTSVAVRVAYELLQAGHRYLDVRTPEEFSAGHVPGALNIPYLFRVGSVGALQSFPFRNSLILVVLDAPCFHTVSFVLIDTGMTKNPNFLAQVSSHFGKDDEILIFSSWLDHVDKYDDYIQGCQSGKRSLMAANDLQSAGYTGIMDVAGGYAAWTQSGLPTEL